MNLFRTEAHAAQQQKHLGSIVVRSPLVFWLLTLAVLLFSVLIMALFAWGEYTRRSTLSGYVLPGAGVVRVHSPSSGRVSDVRVVEGQRVVAGERLLTVVDERHREDGGEARAAEQRLIQARQSSLRMVQTQQRELFALTRTGLRDRLLALRRELEQLVTEQKNFLKRLELAQTTEQRFRELRGQGFVSESQLQEKIEAVSEQVSRMQAQARGQIAIEREIANTQTELAVLPMREQTQLAELARSLSVAEQELIEAQARREVVVTAPQAGIVSGLTAKPGNAVAPEHSLLTLIPDSSAGSTLEAHLFAQSKDAGFVRKGQTVLIRYQAFPYQKFGHYKGSVVEISKTPLSPAELIYPVAKRVEISSLIPAIPSLSPSDPMYRIRVTLERQTAIAYGVAQSLQPGMQLEADIMLDTRTLLEWVFEPLYSLRGKYFK